MSVATHASERQRTVESDRGSGWHGASRFGRSPGGGRALDERRRRQFERAFGSSLTSVRVHTDPAGRAAADALRARAFTVGDHVFLGDADRPGDLAGTWLMAHELAHVVQQRRGGRERPGGAASERDASRAADAVAHGLSPNVAVGSPIGIARQAKDAAAASPGGARYEFVDESGQKKQVTEDELTTLRGEAAARIRQKLARVKGYAETYRGTHQWFMKDVHGQAESFGDLLSDPKSLIGIAVDMRSGVVPPPVSMWGPPGHIAEAGEKALAAGDLREAARLLRLSDTLLHDGIREWNKYMDAIQEGGQKLVSELEVVRDVSFAIAISAAVIVAAPAVAGAVAGTGATGALATGLTATGTAATGAGVGGLLRGSSEAAGQKLAYGKVDTKQVWHETKRGLREGAVTGFTAGLAPGAGQAAGVSARGSTFVEQVARRAIAEGTTNAIGQAGDAALQGKSAKDVIKSGGMGFATGALTAPLGAGGAKLAQSGRPLLSKAVDVAGSGVVAASVTLATGGSREEAGKQAMIAMASSGAIGAAKHMPSGPAAGVRAETAEPRVETPAAAAPKPQVEPPAAGVAPPVEAAPATPTPTTPIEAAPATPTPTTPIEAAPATPTPTTPIEAPLSTGAPALGAEPPAPALPIATPEAEPATPTAAAADQQPAPAPASPTSVTPLPAPAPTTPAARAAAFQARFPKVDASADSMAGLTEIFTRTGSGGRGVAKRPDEYVPVLVRGAAPELRTIVQLSGRPDVERIEIIPSQTGQRTPDFVVHVRQPDGSIRPTRVEVRTLTGATRGYAAVGGGGARISTAGEIAGAVRSKALPHSAQSQLAVPLTGVAPGGTLAVHLPRGGTSVTANVHSAMQSLGSVLSAAPHVHEIQFFLPGTRTMRYVRQPNGTYVPLP